MIIIIIILIFIAGLFFCDWQAKKTCPLPTNIKEGKTNRGFDYSEFTDLYGAECSLQKSSLATDDAIWLGVNNANPVIMASKTVEGGTGWVAYPISEDVLLTTRMHLNREQVTELLPYLQKFANTGEI